MSYYSRHPGDEIISCKETNEQLCGDYGLFKMIIHNPKLSNLILFFLRKGTCSQFLKDERKVVYNLHQNHITFVDKIFKLDDIVLISNLTPFLSYKQLEKLHYLLYLTPPIQSNSRTIISKLIKVIQETPIERSSLSSIQLPPILENQSSLRINYKIVNQQSFNPKSFTITTPIQNFFRTYNQMIIDSHQKNKLTMKNRLFKMGSHQSIETMVCDMNQIPFIQPSVLPQYKIIVPNDLQGTYEGGKKKTTRKRSSSTSKKTSTKKNSTTMKKKTTSKK